MIFESLWPLLFLGAIPIIIILYLLKPKGIDKLISSNLLWQKLVKNVQSKTFFEKFVHNILMYIQILIILLLIISLMAPFIQTKGKGEARKVFLIDTGASMQHINQDGKTRLEEAVALATEYISNAENTKFSIVTADSSDVELLAVESEDAANLLKLLKNLECSDCSGSLTEAQSIIDSLMKTKDESIVELVVFTDANSASDFASFQQYEHKQMHVVGEKTKNVANEYTAYTCREDGLYDVMVNITNYADEQVTLDIGLYINDALSDMLSLRMEPGESTAGFFQGVEWQTEMLETRLGGVTFAGGGRDSLQKDNSSYAIKTKTNLINGLLIGQGNTFLEKGYRAVTGNDITKSLSDYADLEKYNLIIYDAGYLPESENGNRLIFGNPRGDSAEILEHVVLDMTQCPLTAGLEGFHIGVNQAYAFEVPSQAVSFLEYNGKCVGYYQDTEKCREIVVGFDIRETDFPLRAEFPIFLANAMTYLTDTSWLATNIYYAGEKLALQPWAEPDMERVVPGLDKAGLFQIGNDTYEENYIVRFPSFTESDGRLEAESLVTEDEVTFQKIKKTLRNVFILLAVLGLVGEWILYVRQMRYKGKFYLIVRILVLACALLSLADIRISLKSEKTATVFMVDLSGSNEANIDQMNRYIKETIEDMPKNNAYGIVTFGKEVMVEQFLSDKNIYGGLLTEPQSDATNFEDAISKALTMIPESMGARLVILTDGKETGGDINRSSQMILARQAEVLTILYESKEVKDAYINNVILPAYMHPGDKYEINVIVESNYDTDADIFIYSGSKQVAANAVHLNRGSNRFLFHNEVSMEQNREATENIQVRVVAKEDGCSENDTYSAFSIVEAQPRILVISGGGKNLEAFEGVLSTIGVDYHMVSALNAPETINDMLKYSSIIMADTYIDDLPIGFLENLQSYVKDYGCGFICCGGEDSFALGGYKDTVLEEVLPVEMLLKSVNEKVSMDMVMVVDRSGSMVGTEDAYGASNLDLAIKATMVAVQNMSETDRVGVLTFDSVFNWQIELQKVTDKEAICNKIKQIEAGGGTTIKPAVWEAYEVLSQSDATVKHVVLLTDGMGESSDYSDIISAYTDSGITLSTVAVGASSDQKLLEKLARECNGRYYYSDLAGDIPKIFAQEVFLGGDSYIQEGIFQLKTFGNHELTKGLFAEGWPDLLGYIAATPKSSANMLIASADKENPILTTWQYGLGRTIAWNSDVSGEWSAAFSGEEDYAQLWKRMIEYSVGNAGVGEDHVEIVSVGEHAEIMYETVKYSTDTEIVATVIGSDGTKQEIKLMAKAPGKYEADVPTPNKGMYYFNIRHMEKDIIQNYLTTATAVQFSDEYKFDVDTTAFSGFIDKYGNVIAQNDKVWKKMTRHVKEERSTENFFLGIALIFFLFDIGFRRFQYVPQIIINKNVLRKPQKPEEEWKEPVQYKTEPEKNVASKKEHGKKKSEKKKHVYEGESMLDTSLLLRKKDDRNV